MALSFGLTTPSKAQIKDVEIYRQQPGKSSVLKETDISRLIGYGIDLYKGNRADSAINVMLHALEQSSQLKYKSGIDTSLHYLMEYLMAWNRSTATSVQANIIEKAIGYTSDFTQQDVRLSWLYDALGGSFFEEGRYAQGLLEYEKALKALPDDTNRLVWEMKVTIYTNLSGIWAVLEEEQEALNMLKKAQEIAIKEKNFHRQSTLLQHKGILYFNNGDLDSALFFLKASLDLSDKHINNHPKGCKCRQFTIANLSQVLIKQHKPDTALRLITKEIMILESGRLHRRNQGFKQSNIDYLTAFFKYLEGYAYYELKNYTKSRDILLPLLSLVEAGGINPVETNIHEVLAAQYDSTGQYEKAYRHKTAYTNLVTDHEAQKEKSKLLALNYSMEKMKALAQKQVLISRQRAEIREKNIWIGAASFGSVLLATSLFAFYRSNRSKQRLQHSSIVNFKQEKEIAQLQAKVEGEEQERSRIAHELHDGIVSQLLSLKLSMNALQMRNSTVVPSYELNDIAIQLEEATKDLRRTAHNLMPDLLLQQGLALSVAALCEKVNRNTTIEADFQAYGILPRLPQDTELALYRMVQELVQNVLKHAAATQLLVQLSCRDNLLSITVEDNGKGIPMSSLITIEKSTGLANIRKRTELMGGQLDIQSKLDERTNVYLEFELASLLT